MATIPIYIPTYISDQTYNPSRVLPRLLFFNGMLDCESFYIESGSSFGGVAREQTKFPYFDNYNVVSGSFPTTDSKSLLFLNETAVYGELPTDTLYSDYWTKYVELLYNPRTRLLNASTIIPLADYFKMELNDIVELRGNYYHLRAINDYNLKNGECNIQLLGPILDDALVFPIPTTTTSTTSTTSTSTSTSTTTAGTTTTTFSNNPCICTEVVITSAGGEVQTFNCYGINENYVYMNAGTYYLCAASIGGLLQAFFSEGTTGTISPVGNCKTQTCPPATTTSTSTSTTTSTTSTSTSTTTSTTSTTTAAPFYEIVGYATTYVDACDNPISSFPMTGNGTTFCNSTTFTSATWNPIATGNYVVAYNGNYQQVSHTFGQGYATVYGGGCTACPTTTTSTSTTTTTTSGPTYNYYDVTRFDCPNCTNPAYSLVARNNTSYGTLTTSHYYNNGDGYVYRIDGYNAGPSYTIDLDLAATSGTNCSLTCAI